jgi:hypothetical protein
VAGARYVPDRYTLGNLDGTALERYGAPMMRLLRLVLLSIIALLMVSTVVIGLGTSDTGFVEKGVLIAFGGLLILAAVKVHSLGTHPSP